MNVLIACEESQRVCSAFRERGHKAFSCDIIEPSGNHPEWHILGDCLPLLNGGITFTTMSGQQHTIDGKWHLIIAHPPCTDLAVSGARWFKEKQTDGRQQRSIDFFMQFVNAECERMAIENPIGIMSRLYRKPDQIIQPYMFGDRARKATCLWLKGLPKLEPTDIVDFGDILKGGYSVGACADYARDEDGRAIAWNDPRWAQTPVGHQFVIVISA